MIVLITESIQTILIARLRIFFIKISITVSLGEEHVILRFASSLSIPLDSYLIFNNRFLSLFLSKSFFYFVI